MKGRLQQGGQRRSVLGQSRQLALQSDDMSVLASLISHLFFNVLMAKLGSSSRNNVSTFQYDRVAPCNSYAQLPKLLSGEQGGRPVHVNGVACRYVVKFGLNIPHPSDRSLSHIYEAWLINPA